MKRFLLKLIVACVLLISGGANSVQAQSSRTSSDGETAPVERLKSLFQKYNRQRVDLKTVFERLGSWEKTELQPAVKQVLKSDYTALKDGLAPDVLREDVRPTLRSTFRKKRKRLLHIIRNGDRYNAAPQNRSLKQNVTQSSVGLFTLYRKPLVYHIQTEESLSEPFFRAVALIRFIRNSDLTLPDRAGALLERIGRAKELISTSSVGRAAELQPHFRENKNVDRANEEVEINLSETERKLIRRVNQYREAFGLRKLLIHEDVTRAARKQSKRMKRKGQLTHLSGNAARNPLLKRLRESGFRAREAGENVARGDHPPIAVLKGWIQSPDHHRNLLSENYRYLGVAKEGTFWTLDMATVPRVRGTEAPSK